MQRVDRYSIKTESKAVLRQQFAALAVASLILFGVSAVFSGFSESFRDGAGFFLIIELAIAGVLTPGVTAMSMRALNGETVHYSDIIKYLPNWLEAILLTAAVFAITLVGLFLFIVPGIVAAILLSQVYYIFVEDPKKNLVDILKESVELMKNRMGEYLLLVFSFVGWALLGIVTLGIAFIWIVPYANLVYAAYYREIKGGKMKPAAVEGAPVSEPAAEEKTVVVDVASVVIEETEGSNVTITDATAEVEDVVVIGEASEDDSDVDVTVTDAEMADDNTIKVKLAIGATIPSDAEVVAKTAEEVAAAEAVEEKTEDEA